MLSQEEVDNDDGGNSACDRVDVCSDEVIPGMKWVNNSSSIIGSFRLAYYLWLVIPLETRLLL